MIVEGRAPLGAAQFEEYVTGFGIFENAAEGREYVARHYTRFLRTLEEVPAGSGRLLEIGAAPFCMTLLLRRCRLYDLDLINYGSQGDVLLSNPERAESHTLRCAGINVECDAFPYPDQCFDVVVCAEVIEHLTFHPSHMLAEIHRVLKPEGSLILTTPNVLRLFYTYASAREIVGGRNVYDLYSGYGPYGRHNREFTPGELAMLVEGCGFSLQRLAVVDLERRSARERVVNRLFRLLLARLFRTSRRRLERSHGEQILMSARPGGPRAAFLPPALYKSTHATDRAQAIFPRIP